MTRARYWLLISLLCITAGCEEENSEGATDTGLADDAASSADVSADTADEDATPTVDAGPDGWDPANCEPSFEAWQRHSKPLVETYCSTCHGEEPQFGAPYSLLDYDALLAGEPGERKVDRMAERLLDGTMPPPTSARLPHTDLDTLVEWTTCGQQHPDHSQGLQASAPVWTAPEDPPSDADHFDVTANAFEIGLDTLDHYECFVIDAPVDADRFMRRFEPVIDDERVVHHLLVSIDRDSDETRDSFRCGGFPPGDGYVYVWAPGQAPIEFEDGGVRIGPDDKFVLQIHYNNGAGVEGVRDSSGFRVYHGPTEGTEYGLASVGSPYIYVRPNSEGQTADSCEVKRDVYIRASWPHMHEIGTEFETIIERADGTEETLIDLTGWSFEAQLIYDTPAQLSPGDKLRTRCKYDNPNDHSVYFGEGTGDEMCFNFMYISPPMDSPCN
ncbi:hypothetical protein FIV42_23530 [Persicimonas caeni]|uniref:Copper type II ascorbate-dependent monooxygenase C-terminal domain-containing protein n=1 Tax=Persicimonas caeni TaxID=2292766 RepID=A0A4Y6PZ56_PERCE|nr:hypothetical protein [Persicimonas caeni]QDG53606.1 hypothetical protein FIV42_23530 [Persicimonas caeni]QED34827.1 hypothetical protein FRD00_23525 [Persicimonas caeni]